MVDAISSDLPAQSSSQTTLAGDFDTFLKLLTTQLENQDPLSPMESEKFTEQLVQFSSVEQQIEMNSQLGSLVTMMRDAETTAALDYLGKEVVVAGSTVHLPAEGDVSGSYTIPAGVDNAVIEIRSDTGQVFRRLDAQTEAGTHTFTWDGTNSDGLRLSEGVYTIDVIANDDEDNAMDVEVTTGGTVTGVESSEDGLSLLVNGIATPLSAIRTIKQGTES